jgi:hypothetical protein
MPTVDLTTALLGCLATCTGYALLLCTKKGKWFALNVTWASVIFGVSIVLGWIATQPAHTVWTDLQFFAAGGFPIVIRSWWLTGIHLWAWFWYEVRNGNNGSGQ